MFTYILAWRRAEGFVSDFKLWAIPDACLRFDVFAALVFQGESGETGPKGSQVTSSALSLGLSEKEWR